MAEVPFAYRARRVVFLLGHFRERHFGFGNSNLALRPEGTMNTEPIGVAAS